LGKYHQNAVSQNDLNPCLSVPVQIMQITLHNLFQREIDVIQDPFLWKVLFFDVPNEQQQMKEQLEGIYMI